MKDIVKLDLFAGIGGFPKGLADAGITARKQYFSEIDKHASAVYQYNFPDAIPLGSVRDVRGGTIERPDIITFGSPCQDLSLAGKQIGLTGERSGLIIEAIRIVEEFRPDIFIWENVKGAFSSCNGADFWEIIKRFTNIGGYRLEWQLLNTAGILPQNRQRIFLVGHLGGRAKQGIFPIQDFFGRNETPCCETWSRLAGVCRAFTTKGGNRYDYETESYIEIGDQLRNLTCLERERLQGFPDNWTAFGVFGSTIKPISKTQRYKMLGNAVTVRVVEEIGKRLI